MTVEDAIKNIDDVLNSDYHYDETIGYQMTSDDFEWLEKSKEALEKQIPKNPVKKNPIAYSKTRDGKCHYDYDYHCPLCDKKLYNNLEHHCPCGQAIDWSDAE